MCMNIIYCYCNCITDNGLFGKYTSMIDLIISAISLIIAIIGCVCVYNFRAHQKEARYGFYQNIKTFLMAFQLYTENSSKAPPSWMNILGKKYDEIEESERKCIQPIASFCSEFFAFLSTTPNQIPPSRKKNKQKQWNNALNCIRKRLFEIKNFDLQAYPEWEKNSLDNTYKELTDSVQTIISEINK